MPSTDVRDQIEQLEDRIESLAERAEQCRKIMLFAKVMIVVGGLVVLAVVVGVIRFNPAALFGGMAAVIGGIVVFGSNFSTMQQTVSALQAAEAERNALIGGMELTVVE
jgi:hypothetical protein